MKKLIITLTCGLAVNANAQIFQGIMDTLKGAKDAIANIVPQQTETKKDAAEEAIASTENPNKIAARVLTGYYSSSMNELDEALKNGLLLASKINFPNSKESNTRISCSFPNTAIGDLKESFKSASGILMPVYRLKRAKVSKDFKTYDFGLEPDWIETEKLHSSLTTTAKIRLLPISDTRKFDAHLQKHLAETIQNHILGIYKSMGSDGGLLPMLSSMNKDQDASDVNRQIAGPFNERYHENVLKNFPEAAYIISAEDTKIVTGYFSALIHNLARSEDKFPAPRGQDLTEIRTVQSIWNSYISAYGYLVGDATQKEAESAAVGSSSRLIKITSEGWIQQWKVLAPELAAAGQVLDTHALARANHIGLISVTPKEVFSNMTALGFNTTKLQCSAYEIDTLIQMTRAGETALQIWRAVEKESTPIVGIFSRGDSGNDRGTGRGCVGWGCNRTIDEVRDSRFKDLRQALQLLPNETGRANSGALNELLVDALTGTLDANQISGSIESGRLK